MALVFEFRDVSRVWPVLVLGLGYLILKFLWFRFSKSHKFMSLTEIVLRSFRTFKRCTES